MNLRVKLLLDTNVYSALGKGQPEISRMVRDAERIFLSSIVMGELLGGFRHGTRLGENLADLRRFRELPRVELVPVTETTADRYGRIYAALRRRGRPIPTNDMWVAAHAMETGADLVSFDPHFREIEGLVWVHPGRPE